jgi:hypothetical protein
MTRREQDARYALMQAQKRAQEAVALLEDGAPDEAAMRALDVVVAADAALRELALRIKAGDAE